MKEKNTAIRDTPEELTPEELEDLRKLQAHGLELLADKQGKTTAELEDGRRRTRERTGAEEEERGGWIKNARACVNCCRYWLARSRGAKWKTAAAVYGVDFPALSAARLSCPELFDVSRAAEDLFLQLTAATTADSIAGIIDGEETTGTHARVAMWAAERLIEDYRDPRARQSASSGVKAITGGGIVINLIAPRDNPVTTATVTSPNPLEPAQVTQK